VFYEQLVHFRHRIANMRHIAFDMQTNKDFATVGQMRRRYVTFERVPVPKLHKDVFDEMILPSHVWRLRPERQFGQTLILR
jgi:hypothetical protein